MTSQAILAKAIRKAVDGGWRVDKYQHHTYFAVGLGSTDVIFSKWESNLKGGPGYNAPYQRDIYSIIFDKDFAKAIWGESKMVDIGRRDAGGMHIFDHPRTLGWQSHLRDMVIADDPIAYLGGHLPD